MESPRTDNNRSDSPCGVLFHNDQRHVALVDPLCIPRDANKRVAGFDFSIGRTMNKLRDRVGEPVENVLVRQDVVWVGNGLVLPDLVEFAVDLLMQELKRNVRVHVPLDKGGTAAYGITNGKVETVDLITTDMALSAIVAKDVSDSREVRLLLVRPDIAVPPQLQTREVVTIPAETNLRGFNTTPAAMALMKSLMPLTSTVRQAAAGCLSATAVMSVAIFVASLLSGALQEPDVPALAEAHDDPDGWLADAVADEGPIVDPTNNSDVENDDRIADLSEQPSKGVDVPSMKSSVRWDLAAWALVATKPPWHRLGVDRLVWSRSPGGEVMVSAIGRDANMTVWREYAAEWGAQIEGSEWLAANVHGTILGEGLPMAMVYTHDGAWDVRVPKGTPDTARMVCLNNLGTVVEDSNSAISCAIEHWVPERWATAGVGMPISRLSSASCSYRREVGTNIITDCVLSFEFDAPPNVDETNDAEIAA